MGDFERRIFEFVFVFCFGMLIGWTIRFIGGKEE